MARERLLDAGAWSTGLKEFGEVSDARLTRSLVRDEAGGCVACRGPDQDRSATCDALGGTRKDTWLRIETTRQHDRERSPRPRRRAHRDTATMRGDDAIGDRQAEPRAARRGVLLAVARGEERFENVFDVPRCHNRFEQQDAKNQARGV